MVSELKLCKRLELTDGTYVPTGVEAKAVASGQAAQEALRTRVAELGAKLAPKFAATVDTLLKDAVGRRGRVSWVVWGAWAMGGVGPVTLRQKRERGLGEGGGADV